MRIEELSDTEAGPLPNASIEKTQAQENDKESQEESSKTLTDSEAKRIFEEEITKRRHEQGGGSNTGRMAKDQVDCIIVVITTATSASEAQLKDYSTGFFHKVKNLLSTLTNAVVNRVPQADITHREAKIATGKRFCIVKIPPWSLE